MYREYLQEEVFFFEKKKELKLKWISNNKKLIK